MQRVTGYQLVPVAPRVNDQRLWENMSDGIYQSYGWMHNNDYYVVRYHVERLRPSSLLEIGCGYGRYFGIYDAAGVQEVHACDISQRMLDKIPEEYRHRHHLFRSDLKDLPDHLPQEVDLVVSNMVLAHVPVADFPAVARGIASVARALLLVENTREANDYTSVHDYREMFAGLGFDVRLAESLDEHGNQLYWMERTRPTTTA